MRLYLVSKTHALLAVYFEDTYYLAASQLTAVSSLQRLP